MFPCHLLDVLSFLTVLSCALNKITSMQAIVSSDLLQACTRRVAWVALTKPQNRDPWDPQNMRSLIP
jgi:hypothetical protein